MAPNSGRSRVCGVADFTGAVLGRCRCRSRTFGCVRRLGDGLDVTGLLPLRLLMIRPAEVAGLVLRAMLLPATAAGPCRGGDRDDVSVCTRRCFGGDAEVEARIARWSPAISTRSNSSFAVTPLIVSAAAVAA